MFDRFLRPQLSDAIAHSPAVALLGPRQVGKTTLAIQVGEREHALYLDLESEQDRAKLSQPELYLTDHLDKLVILDEVHRAPGLFPVLRGLIDRNRREGRRFGQYLLLGSASPDLLKQSGETLAGRIAYLELTPLQVLETSGVAADELWVRGGFPESLLAADAAHSLRWRRKFHSHLSGARYPPVRSTRSSGNLAPVLGHAGALAGRAAQCGAVGAQQVKLVILGGKPYRGTPEIRIATLLAF